MRAITSRHAAPMGQWVGHQVRALVGKHWPAIVRVAEQLLLRGELTSSELKALMAGE